MGLSMPSNRFAAQRRGCLLWVINGKKRPSQRDVRFTPESGHQPVQLVCRALRATVLRRTLIGLLFPT
jgi:hypothetical protein